MRRFRNSRSRPGALALGAAIAVIATSGIAFGQATQGLSPEGSSVEQDQSATEAKKQKPRRVQSRVSVRYKRHVLSGKRMKVGGRVWPRKGRRVLLIKVNGKRVKTVRASRNGRFTARWRAPRPGRYKIKVIVRKTKRAWGKTRRLKRPVNVYRTGHASYYGPGFYGGRTACGQTLSSSTQGVAHKSLPCGTKVTFRYKGRTATVRVIDRGPYVAGRDWDLTSATKSKLGFGSTGTVLSTR